MTLNDEFIVALESVFQSEAEFNLYEQFNKGEKLRPLGPLYKVKPLMEEEIARPLLARVVNF